MHRCYHCKKTIQTLAKAQYFALVLNKQGNTVEAYIHTRCLDAFNGKESDALDTRDASPDLPDVPAPDVGGQGDRKPGF